MWSVVLFELPYLTLGGIGVIMHKCIVSLVLAVTCLAGVPGVSAQTTEFWNVPDGDWSTDSNWSPQLVPTANSFVFITNGGTARLTTDGFASAIFIGNGPSDSGTLELFGSTTLTVRGSLTTIVGNEGTGTLTLRNGSEVRISNSDFVTLRAGNGGTGTINLLDNSTLSLIRLDDSVPPLEVGLGDLRLANADGSSGTLNIGDGGSAGRLSAASVRGSSGTAISPRPGVSPAVSAPRSASSPPAPAATSPISVRVSVG